MNLKMQAERFTLAVVVAVDQAVDQAELAVVALVKMLLLDQLQTEQ
jgi:hypothetical protein